jgi:hypothetical protein
VPPEDISHHFRSFLRTRHRLTIAGMVQQPHSISTIYCIKCRDEQESFTSRSPLACSIDNQ